jgi:hypothetical protein
VTAHYPRGVEAPPEGVESHQIAGAPFYQCPKCKMGFLLLERFGIPLKQVVINQLANQIEQRHDGWLHCCDVWFRWNEKSD